MEETEFLIALLTISAVLLFWVRLKERKAP